MEYKKYINYSVEDFVLDKDFTKWVLSPDLESDKFWNHFLQNHPKKKNQILEATVFIKAMRAVELSVPKQRLQRVYSKIKQTHRSPRRRLISQFMRYAAVFVLLVCLGGVIYFLNHEQEQLPVVRAEKELFEKGQLILPDGTINEFDNEISEIQQKATGELTLNDDTISLAEASGGKSKTELAHVIIPYGKRSEITLSDGTRIWLNSGSQLSYPLYFNNDSRTVYLTGEAFFDVNSEPSRPFYVITNDMKVEVTGTRFNVTSYNADQTTQAVLLEGKIAASKNKRFTRTIELMPGERIVYNKQGDAFEKDQVNVELYASWIDGYLIFDNEPVDIIFTKLERYYNQTIKIEKLNELPKFTGKLDLADDLEKVLENIAFSASFSVKVESKIFFIKPL